MDQPTILRFNDGLNHCEWVHKRDYDRLAAELATVKAELPEVLRRLARAAFSSTRAAYEEERDLAQAVSDWTARLREEE